MIDDTQRLLFIVESNGRYVIRSNEHLSIVWDILNGLECVGEGKTYRDAIDDAIIKTKWWKADV